MIGTRIANSRLLNRRKTANEAAALIEPGMTVAMSGFTGAHYPKAVPPALAAQIGKAHVARQDFRNRVLTGASTAPEFDSALARAKGISLRLPYQSDPYVRQQINAGKIDYIDIHLSNAGQHTWFGFFGEIGLALIEVSSIRANGSLIPSTSVGNNKNWLDQAKGVILEVNHRQPEQLDGMYDSYYGTALPAHRRPIPPIDPNCRNTWSGPHARASDSIHRTCWTRLCPGISARSIRGQCEPDLVASIGKPPRRAKYSTSPE